MRFYRDRDHQYKGYEIERCFALGKKVWGIKITDYLNTFLRSRACPQGGLTIEYVDYKPAYILCNTLSLAKGTIDECLIDHELYID